MAAVQLVCGGTELSPQGHVREADVIVAGAGPTGLMLAHELALAGVRPTVLETLAEPTGQSRALNLHPRTAEILEMRGLLARLQAHPIQLGFLTRSFFAGIPVALDNEPFGSRFPQQIGVLQSRVEAMLEERLGTVHGITVERGRELIGFEQDEHGVTATVRGPEGRETLLRGRYLVGCDGSRSRVRRVLGLPFDGTDGGPQTRVAADVVLVRPPEKWFDGQAPQGVGEVDGRDVRMLPDVGLTGMITLSEGGRQTHFSLVGLENGVYRLMFSDPEQVGGRAIRRDAPITEREIQEVLHAVGGPAAELKELLWASRFGDACRQVDRYRVERVLLAGDAAHIVFPIGGQGMNLGLQDAFNLGWKLAAAVNGWAPDGLLDTYHRERHPVAAAILGSARAQSTLLSREQDMSALRDLLTALVELPETNRYLAGLTSGLTIRYGAPEEAGGTDGAEGADGNGHPLVGRLMPDLDLTVGGEPVRFGELMHTGRGVLLELREADGPSRLAPAVHGRADRLGHVVADPAAGQDVHVRAALIRPDGHVCWASQHDTGPDDAALRAALTRWFG
ncbi:FAD-dependent monooxygenase [Streptomyces sp. S465]|uniref:FAD-dependent monooxygenase n=1 Tax=Streptomyces sp. S465 TaxID=2979468 RepID=UPI0022A8D166|nr:FAD-dependent monooxygenase [Streptomyces sp. S465]WAP57583.1 FAD-dependent monooxygenase [Streptomyces sp. S465]